MPIRRSARLHTDIIFDATAPSRICPGMHVANRSVFINTAFMLWAFRLLENPAAPIDSFAFTDTVNIHALPFEVVFQDRVPRAEIRKLCSESLIEE